MAGELKPEQVAGVADALKTLKAEGQSFGASSIVESLRSSSQTVFTPADLESIGNAISALEQSRDTKPAWSAAANRGLFFVFEGLDRSGKSTQSKLLHKKPEEAGSVKWMCFPNRQTPVGVLIDMYLRRMIDLPDETIHQLFSANRWETVLSVVETLNSGTSVVCDRYAFSGVAYSAAKGLDFTWCQTVDVGLPVPDGVFFLHVDESVGASRQAFGDERYENTDMQSRVRQQFKSEQLRAGVAWHDVDGAREIPVIHDEICEAVENIRKTDQENPVRPIRRLWMS